MQVQTNYSVWTSLKSGITGKNYYKTDNGVKVAMKKDTGNIEVKNDGSVYITGGEKVSVKGTKGDDKIYVKDSDVRYIEGIKGNDKIALDNCKTKKTRIYTYEGWSSKSKDTCDILIKGNFDGRIYAQQADGKGWGDKKAHKDNICITGNNNGKIQVDSQDKVYIKGPEKGKVFNTTTYIVPM